MKKFILTILCAAVFFIGLGGLIEKTGAQFKSDERALAIIAQARQAIGGEAAIQSVKSLTINGQVQQTLNFDGTTRTEQGELEINFQLPNKFSKQLRIGKPSGVGHSGETGKQIDKIVVVTKNVENAASAPTVMEVEPNVIQATKTDNGQIVINETATNNSEQKIVRKVVVNRTESGEMNSMRQNELFRTTFALLLSAPEGIDASYSYAGESSVDGSKCDVILAQSSGNSVKLFIDQSSHLPLMMSYQSTLPMAMSFKFGEPGGGENQDENQPVKTVIINRSDRQTVSGGDVKVFSTQTGETGKTAEFEVRFSDYRSVSGLQLPYKWTKTANGKPDQNVDVADYDVNPANIAEKFNHPVEKIMIVTPKSQ